MVLLVKGILPWSAPLLTLSLPWPVCPAATLPAAAAKGSGTERKQWVR
jgi:hypothetical protein